MTLRRVLFIPMFLACLLAHPLNGAEGEDAPREAARVPSVKVVHVIVALCDQTRPGMEHVPPSLGNATDPARNLYWGAQYGVKTWFRGQAAWTQVRSPEGEIAIPHPAILRRVVFFHKDTSTYLVADAYDGTRVREAIRDVLFPRPGDKVEGVVARPIYLGTRADLRVYVGYNALNDDPLQTIPTPQRGTVRPAIFLTPDSSTTFTPYLEQAELWPLLGTHGSIEPEAYVLDAAIRAWAEGDDPETIRVKAAEAYAQYQELELDAAKAKFVAGTPPAPAPDPQPATNGQAERDAADSTHDTDPPTGNGSRAATVPDGDDTEAPPAGGEGDADPDAGASHVPDAGAPSRVGTLPLPPSYVQAQPEEGWSEAELAWRSYLLALPLEAPAPSIDAEGHGVDGAAGTAAEGIFGVVRWPPPHRLQQSAGVAIRAYATFLREQGRPVSFRSMSGDEIAYDKWLAGEYRISDDGARILYIPHPADVPPRGDTEAEFDRYLTYVMTYTNVTSLLRDVPRVPDGMALRWGDLYIQPPGGGHRGHVSLILQMATGTEDDTSRLYLFGGGGHPARPFEVYRARSGEGYRDWFTLDGFFHRMKAFGEGTFHRFPLHADEE